MSSRDNQFGAAPSAAGYLYQARLALFLSIPYVNSGIEVEVSVERLDDVSFEKDGTPFELLQTKHHIDRIASLTDASPDIWKTLRVWAESAATDPSLPSRVKLLLITTAEAPAGSAASLLRSRQSYDSGAKRNPKLANKILTAIAETSDNKALKSAFSAFLALSDAMRSSLLSAVEVVDRQPLLTDLGAELEHALRLIAPTGKAALAREMLEGWWWPRICEVLMASPADTIPISALEAKLDDVRELLKREALIADFEHAEPSDSEIAEYDGFRFVKQLHIIGLGGNRLRFAKRDYYRAFVQRSKWTREHVVLDEELEKFEQRLVEEWEPRFTAMCDAHAGDEINDSKLKQDAQEIYYWVETEARLLISTRN